MPSLAYRLLRSNIFVCRRPEVQVSKALWDFRLVICARLPQTVMVGISSKYSRRETFFRVWFWNTALTGRIRHSWSSWLTSFLPWLVESKSCKSVFSCFATENHQKWAKAILRSREVKCLHTHSLCKPAGRSTRRNIQMLQWTFQSSQKNAQNDGR